jgi:hypothetical protein
MILGFFLLLCQITSKAFNKNKSVFTDLFWAYILTLFPRALRPNKTVNERDIGLC